VSRYWSPVRQAYAPRLWPQVLVTTPLALVLGYVCAGVIGGWLGFALLVVGSCLLGFGSARARWAIWRRRHPELPPEVWTRELARWN
jgi:hypothetical protein